MAEGLLGPLSAKQLESVKVSTRNQKFLAELINNILDITQLQAGKMPLDKGRLFRGLVVDVAESLRVRAEEFGVTVRHDGVADGAFVFADQQALKRVLMNLFSNALKFTPSGGSISFGYAPLPSTGARIWVTDTGIGIPETKIHQLFQKFSQISETRNKVRQSEGTGLGLVICKHIVEAHGGKIGVQSEYQKGTTFWLELPPEPEQDG